MKGLYVPGGRSHRTMKQVALTDALEMLHLAGRLRNGEYKKLYALLDRADINNPPRGEESNGHAEARSAHRGPAEGVGSPSRAGLRGMHYGPNADR
jgi:hypothetical protein